MNPEHIDKQTQRQEVVFIDGFYSDEISPTTPVWILGRGSLHLDRLSKFINDNRHRAVNGQIKYTVKRNRNGERYVTVDHYAMEKYKEFLAKSAEQTRVEAEGFELVNPMDDIQ